MTDNHARATERITMTLYPEQTREIDNLLETCPGIWTTRSQVVRSAIMFFTRQIREHKWKPYVPQEENNE
jgi:Arc/MetJ-type ribon-helix-helix transcriptional regulator